MPDAERIKKFLQKQLDGLEKIRLKHQERAKRLAILTTEIRANVKALQKSLLDASKSHKKKPN
jgi:hypothetical protein